MAAEIKLLLKRYDPTERLLTEGGVCLITHLGCERQLAEAIGIPYISHDDPRWADESRTGHFWGMRGSNRFNECPITFVVGTPSLDPEHVHRLARALYADDPAPLVEGSDQRDDQWHYLDARVQHLADWLSHSELTQCAHRARPLRYDGRIIVTLCMGDVDYLPVTTEITHLPQLLSDGQARAVVVEAKNDARFREAAGRLKADGVRVSIRTIAATAHASLRDVAAWWKVHHTDHQDISQPDVHAVTNYAIEISNGKLVTACTSQCDRRAEGVSPPHPPALSGSLSPPPPPDRVVADVSNQSVQSIRWLPAYVFTTRSRSRNASPLELVEVARRLRAEARERALPAVPAMPPPHGSVHEQWEAS